MKKKDKHILQTIFQSMTLKVDNYKEIKTGFSTDKKYILKTATGVFLLRLSGLDQAQNRKNEFEIIKKAYELGVKCNQPVTFAEMKEFEICYSCFQFIPGEDALTSLPKLSDNDAFNIGKDAGKDLKTLNRILPTQSVTPWEERKRTKHEMYTKEYKKSGYSFKGDREILNYITSEMDQMCDTKNVFQHDDFHVGNIIIHNHQYNGVIDFNRMDWGDYVHDFVKLGWFSRYTSEAFAHGQIAGYFGDVIPDYFWRRYSLYMAMSIFSTIVWHQKYFPKLLSEMKKYLTMVLHDHDYFIRLKPKWIN
jgi:aminoglycoside phosphotransferase (APT) family kinase protein